MPTTSASDQLLELDVIEVLVTAPHIDAAQIGVSVMHGVVTLSGEVDSHASCADATSAALTVRGVTVVANEVLVRNSPTFRNVDTDIASSIKHMLEWSTELSHCHVLAELHNRVVTLTGVVTWDHQRRAAARAIRGLVGGLEIDNRIELTPQVPVAS